MGESLSAALWLPLVVGLALSILPDYLLKPKAAQLQNRPLAAHLIHLGLWLLLFALEILVIQRPWFAITVITALLVLFALISNTKYETLREPLIYQDNDYITDILRHPRLYIPFFGIVRTIIGVLITLALYWLGISLETSLPTVFGWIAWLQTIVFCAVSGAVLLWVGHRLSGTPTLDPKADLAQLGILASLWSYGREERRQLPQRGFPFDEHTCLSSTQKPADLVVIQSESFFDPRTLYSGIRSDILENFDAICKTSLSHGSLVVPAWGANTVRSEFAFLSGLSATELGVHQFNPYRRLAYAGIPTLASELRRQGYRTVCIHPYAAEFYNRDRIYPLLGFDHFIDVEAFEPSQRFGPFIGDIALADKIAQVINEAEHKPLFLFVITMENHGPLHLEQVVPGDEEELYISPPPAGCEELTIYLRHLKNADLMLKRVTQYLSSSERDSLLCWYGDHVPAIPKVYDKLGDPSGESNYLLWSPTNITSGEGCNIKLEKLARACCDHLANIDST